MLVALLVAFEPIAWAAPECDPDDPELCSAPVNEGDPAPFSGQILTTKLAISLGQKADSFEARLKIELERVDGIWGLKLQYEQDTHRIDNTAKDKQIEVLQEALARAVVKHWYEHPGYIATISVIATILVFVGTAYLIQAVSD